MGRGLPAWEISKFICFSGAELDRVAGKEKSFSSELFLHIRNQNAGNSHQDRAAVGEYSRSPLRSSHAQAGQGTSFGQHIKITAMNESFKKENKKHCKKENAKGTKKQQPVKQSKAENMEISLKVLSSNNLVGCTGQSRGNASVGGAPISLHARNHGQKRIQGLPEVNI